MASGGGGSNEGEDEIVVTDIWTAYASMAHVSE